MTSADDLLKTRTIPELRKLVHSLASDADGKQAELRSMVNYHLLCGFIICYYFLILFSRCRLTSFFFFIY